MMAQATRWSVDETKILTRQEVSAVLANLRRLGRRSKNSRMNLAIVRLATCCGLRASEIAGLRLSDVRLAVARPVIRVAAATSKGKAKGAKTTRKTARNFPLWKLPSVLADLAAWKDERERQGAKPGDYLVCALSKSAFGHKLDRRNLRKRYIASCRCLGAERQANVTIHHGRHTTASHLLAGGWPLPAVRDALGHANISTTSLYAHLGVDEDEPVHDVFEGL